VAEGPSTRQAQALGPEGTCGLLLAGGERWAWSQREGIKPALRPRALGYSRYYRRICVSSSDNRLGGRGVGEPSGVDLREIGRATPTWW